MPLAAWESPWPCFSLVHALLCPIPTVKERSRFLTWASTHMVRILRTLMSNSLLMSSQAVTSVLDDAGSALNSRSNEPLDLGDRSKPWSSTWVPVLDYINYTNIIHSQENVTGAATPAQNWHAVLVTSPSALNWTENVNADPRVVKYIRKAALLQTKPTRCLGKIGDYRWSIILMGLLMSCPRVVQTLSPYFVWYFICLIM